MSETSLSPLVDKDDMIEFGFWAWPASEGDYWKVQVEGKSRPKANARRLEFTFKRPSAKDINTIRRRCTEFDAHHGMFLINQEKLQVERVKNLLREWNFVRVFNDTEMEIHTIDGKMVDKSLRIVYQMDPVLFKTMMEELSNRID